MSRAVALMVDHVRELKALVARVERDAPEDKELKKSHQAKLERLQARLAQAEQDLAIVRGDA